MFPNKRHTQTVFIFYYALFSTIAGPLPILHAVNLKLLFTKFYVLSWPLWTPWATLFRLLHLVVMPLCPAVFSDMTSLLSSTLSGKADLPFLSPPCPSPGIIKSRLRLSSPAIGCWHPYLPIRTNSGQVPRSSIQTLSCKQVFGEHN